MSTLGVFLQGSSALVFATMSFTGLKVSDKARLAGQ